MMRLRQAVWAAVPAMLVAISMLAPGLHAARPRRVKHTVAVKHKVPTRPGLHAVPSHRDSRHLAVHREIIHKVPSRRAKVPREHRARISRFRMPASPSADRIEQIQQVLAKNGFYQGDPSGRWDPDTVDAMKSFQQAHGLAPTGKIDASSLQQLGLGSDVAGLAPPHPQIAADSAGPGE